MADGATLARRPGSAADRIVFLGHATVLIEVDGVRLLTDPLLRGRVAHLRRQVPPVDPALFDGLDAVLISHLHHDHLDLPSLRQLGSETPLVVPAGAGGLLRRRGFVDVTELSVGELASVGALAVTAVKARHDGRRLAGPGSPRAETLGYLIGGRRTVYFAGDTELFDGMADLMAPSGSGDRSDGSRELDMPTGGGGGDDDDDDRSCDARELDVALLPVAGWGPTLGPGHMGPLDAARAAGLLRPRIAIPVHWGTLLPIGIAARHRERLGEPPREFAEHVSRLFPSIEVRVLEPGGETTL
jgi:L-ascorbate metabolism protein UlaG (beta-lactamase superfamily)